MLLKTPENEVDEHHGAEWDISLTDEEVETLASGVSPTLIQPTHLVYFCPAEYYAEN